MSEWNFTPVSIIYFIATGVSFLLVILGLKLRPVRGAVIFSLMMFFVGIWVLASTLSLFSHDFDWKIIMIKFEYLGMAGSAFLWLIFISKYTNFDKWLKVWVYIPLLSIPILTLYHIARAPNDSFLHECFYLVTVNGVSIFATNFAGGFFLWTAYAYTMLLLGFVFLIIRIYQLPAVFRKQLIFLTPIVFIVLIPNALFITGYNPIKPYDPTPLTLAFVGVLFLLSMYYHNFLDVTPVAHDLVFKNVKSAVIIIDFKGRINEINPAAAFILGMTSNDLLGKDFKESLPEISKNIEGFPIKSELTTEIVLGNDKRFYELKVNPLIDNRSQLKGAILMLWDITEQKQAVSELDAYARTVAHDLKTPLGQISGFAKLVADPDCEEGDKLNYLEHIISGSEKMRTIIDGLLMLAKIRNQDTINKVTVDMRVIMQNVLLRFTESIQNHHAEIILPVTWHKATGNSIWVEEIWVNLLSNALKFGGLPPKIEFGSIDNGNFVKFWIKDNGAGLTIAEQEKLFAEFLGFPTQTPSIKGHGLGLSIVERIVSKLGGEVGIESTPGQGSMFYFTLPA